MSRTAVLAGATGLIGRHCLRLLASEPSYSKVSALVRRPSGLSSGKSFERVVDYEALDLTDLEPGADIFCTLGTTIQKAGSQEAFRKVDFGHVVNLAKRSLEAGTRQFAVVSSVGADAASSNFYLRTKGEMEQAIAAMAFHGVYILRPSFLIGDRQESRPGERIGIALAKALGIALRGPLRKYHAIDAGMVAASMIAAVRNGKPGVHLYEYDHMRRLATGR